MVFRLGLLVGTMDIPTNQFLKTIVDLVGGSLKTAWYLPDLPRSDMPSFPH
jgi:hypothetical protein